MSEQPPSSRDFTWLYRSTLAPLRRHLARILASQTETQDVAHDAYLRVYPTVARQEAVKPERPARRLRPLSRGSHHPRILACRRPGAPQAPLRLLSIFRDLEQQPPLLAGVRDELAENQTASKTARSFPWLRWPTLAGATLATVAALAVFLWWASHRITFKSRLSVHFAAPDAFHLPTHADDAESLLPLFLPLP